MEKQEEDKDSEDSTLNDKNTVSKKIASEAEEVHGANIRAEKQKFYEDADKKEDGMQTEEKQEEVGSHDKESVASTEQGMETEQIEEVMDAKVATEKQKI